MCAGIQKLVVQAFFLPYMRLSKGLTIKRIGVQENHMLKLTLASLK